MSTRVEMPALVDCDGNDACCRSNKEFVDVKSLMCPELKQYLAPHHCVSWSGSSLKGSIFFTLDLAHITVHVQEERERKHISIPVVKSTSFCDYRDLTTFRLDVQYQGPVCTEIVPSFQCKENDPNDPVLPGCAISYHQSFHDWPTKLIESLEH